MFSCEFSEIFKNTFSYRTPPVAASDENNVPTGISKKWDRDHGVGPRTRDPRMGSWGEKLAYDPGDEP